MERFAKVGQHYISKYTNLLQNSIFQFHGNISHKLSLMHALHNHAPHLSNRSKKKKSYLWYINLLKYIK